MNSNTGTAAAVGSVVPDVFPGVQVGQHAATASAVGSAASDVVPGVQVGQHATLGHHLGPLPVGRVGALRRALEK